LNCVISSFGACNGYLLACGLIHIKLSNSGVYSNNVIVGVVII
jgi:hypothetical protein